MLCANHDQAQATAGKLIKKRGQVLPFIFMISYYIFYRLGSSRYREKGFSTSGPQRNVMGQSTEMSPLVSMLFLDILLKSLEI